MNNQLNLTDIYRKPHSASRYYSFFSCAHETFTKIDHIVSHKTSPDLKELEPSKVCSLSPMKSKLEINHRKIPAKPPKKFGN